MTVFDQPGKVPSVHEALIAVRREVGAVGKDKRNESGNYNFRGVDAVVNASSPHLIDNGVSIVPRKIRQIQWADVLSGGKRTPMASTRILIKWRVYGPAGDWFDIESAGEAFDSGDKATPKAESVAWRTALIQLLHLRTDDPDPDAFTYDRNEIEAQQLSADEQALVDAKKRVWNLLDGAPSRYAVIEAKFSQLDTKPNKDTATLADWTAVAVDLELNGYDIARPADTTEPAEQPAAGEPPVTGDGVF